MSLFWIKVIALLTMVADHIGLFFFPNIILFRVIGRLSFPLFAWAIANGSIYTKNINKYLFRIFLLAVLSQIPYQFLFDIFGNYYPGLNILFTFSIGLVGIILCRKFKNSILRVIIIFALSFLAILFAADYGAFGVMSVIGFYKYFRNSRKRAILYISLVLFFFLLPVLINEFFGKMILTSPVNILELFSILPLYIISKYKGVIGYKMKYFFYIFYPVHLFIISLVRILISK
jgi:hypothetical protein